MKNKELILECNECNGSRLYTPARWENAITYLWCSCGGMLEPVAWAADLQVAPKERSEA